MVNQERITQTVFEVIDELNQLLPAEQHLEKDADTPLFGKSGRLDSLGLVNLIVATEQKIEEKFDGAAITLADSMTLPEEHSPFTSVGKLVDHLSLLLEQETNGQTHA
ncbi:MAG: hypothetical protein KJ077_21750 [Anaerolineae bacterium]|nr:hypothetical protein [Anaerolineae bacterium]